jgi:hypothetical protein
VMHSLPGLVETEELSSVASAVYRFKIHDFYRDLKYAPVGEAFPSPLDAHR